MNDSSGGEQERYDRMLMLGTWTVFWTIPTYFVLSLLFLKQPIYVYWALGLAWLLGTLGLLAMKQGRRGLSRICVLATIIEAVSVLVLAGGPHSNHVGAIFPAVAGSAFLLSARITMGTAAWFFLVYGMSLLLDNRGFYDVHPELDPASVFAQIATVCVFIVSVLSTYQRALKRLLQQQTELAEREAEAASQHDKQIQLERRLRQGEKMEAFGNFAGGVAHDFNNLLTGIMGHAEIVQRALAKDKRDQQLLKNSLQQLIHTAQRGADITRGLLSFSRTDGGRAEPINVAETLGDFELTLRRLLPEDIRIVTTYEEGLYANLPLRAVEQIVMNLVTNARDAMTDGGRLTLHCASIDITESHECATGPLHKGRYIRLTVADTGLGMSDEVRKRVFEPFFSTRRPGVGTGLGMSTVHGIVTRAGGGIVLTSSLGLGTSVQVFLPQIDSPTSPRDSEPKQLVARSGREHILVCEDEQSILSVVKRTLEEHGYQVFGFNDPSAALKAVKEGTVRPEVLLTDVVMPGMNGRVLSEQLKARVKDLPVLYMSGHTDGILEARGVSREEILLLQKPFTSKQLLSAVRECLEHANS